VLDRKDKVAPVSVERATSPSGLFKIGEVCERVGLSLRTVRYYDEIGLLTPSDRSPGGFRLYSEEDVSRLTVLKGMKPMGLTLDEIRDLMQVFDLAEDPSQLTEEDIGSSVAALRAFASKGDERVAQLEATLAEVRRLNGRIGSALDSLRAKRP
jgi:DNA-binding transcriptional MerR regulator